MKILIAEDNTVLLKSLCMAVRLWGYWPDGFDDGDEAYYAAISRKYDVMLFDVGMPGMSGFEIVRELRRNGNNTPALFLTARDTLADKTEGFGAGCDDYLVKPFEMAELQMRIKAIIRRTTPSLGSALVLKDVVVAPEKNQATVNSHPLSLTARELQLLEYLIINQGRIVSKEQIQQRIEFADHSINSNVVSVHVHNLRKKLAAAGSKVSIDAVRGLGYRIS